MKINCQFHNDLTASMKVYEDHFYCFGCGKSGGLSLLSGDTNNVVKRANASYKPKEDINQKLTYIRTLPNKSIRGFMLPYDESGYYVIYPFEPYYTKRLVNPLKESDKYRGPMGHKKPLFRMEHPTAKMLFVVEGQLNAMSLYASMDIEASVVSPGGATDLCRPDFVRMYLQYTHICVIVDKDPAGVVSGLALVNTLIKANKNAVLLPLEVDLNEVYVKKGPDAVKEEVKRGVVLFRGL